MISTCVRVPRRAAPRRAQVFLATDDSGVAAEARAVFPAAGMVVRTLQSDRHIPRADACVSAGSGYGPSRSHWHFKSVSLRQCKSCIDADTQAGDPRSAQACKGRQAQKEKCRGGPQVGDHLELLRTGESVGMDTHTLH
jgi:hypothetical protein